MSQTLLATKNNVYDRLTAAAIDGRGQNVRYRQNQLHLLHGFLARNVDTVCAALSHDAEDSSAAETEVEFYLTMSVIKRLFDSLNFEQAMEDEYAVARKKDNPNRRMPYGVVIVRPTTFTRFYSIMTAVAAALAAGNCVLLELEPSLRQVDSFIRQKLTVLDPDIFAITTEQVQDNNILHRSLLIDQVNLSQELTSSTVRRESLISNGHLQAVAIVDRSADIPNAASELCSARFSFGGKSPYAPDMVLVNEWVKGEFIEECLRCIAAKTRVLKSVTSSAKGSKDATGAFPDGTIVDYYVSSKINFLEVKTRDPNLISQKIASRTLLISAISGLVDGVTVASEISPLLACYHFCSPEAGKFLSQHIDSQATFINQVPVDMLVGPASPVTDLKPNFFLRYDMDMLSYPRPEYIAFPASGLSTAIDLQFLEIRNQRHGSNPGIIGLREKAIRPLKPIDQPSGSGMGFFDQGIITGLVAFVLPSLALLGYGGYRLVRMASSFYLS